MNAGQSGGCSDCEFVFVLDNLISTIAGFLYNSTSLLGIAAGLGSAKHFQYLSYGM